MAVFLELTVNGQPRRIEADPAKSLLAVLREDLDLTGSKYGCGEGQCGACTVLLDGRAVRSCVTPVGGVGARPVVTIEGLERDLPRQRHTSARAAARVRRPPAPRLSRPRSHLSCPHPSCTLTSSRLLPQSDRRPDVRKRARVRVG